VPKRSADRPARPWLARLALVVLVALAGCAVTGPDAPSTAPSSNPACNLATPGAATAAVGKLVNAAGTSQAIRVTIDLCAASLTYLQNDEAISLGWEDGQVATLDSDVVYVGQAGFDVYTFNFNNVGLMFTEAANLAGSSDNQELQINEYNDGRVLMTVTTSPESQTIFFQPDATLVPWLDFTTPAGLAAALTDVAGDGVQLLDLGLDDEGFYADVRVTQTIIERRTRPAKQPAYIAQRTAASTYQSFGAGIINTYVLSNLLNTVPASLDKPDARTSLIIDRRDSLPQPIIRISVGLTTRLFTLDGIDVTDQLH